MGTGPSATPPARARGGRGRPWPSASRAGGGSGSADLGAAPGQGWEGMRLFRFGIGMGKVGRRLRLPVARSKKRGEASRFSCGCGELFAIVTVPILDFC
jgi:hypothetical protein